jgi:ATPase subunit of ABC transporter with duplicated ATPase domains
VIGPRIQKALVELTQNVNNEVDRLTRELLLSDESQERIADVASLAAEKAAQAVIDAYAERNDEIIATLERMIPRRIEVVTKTDTRILPAEPRHEIFEDLLETLLLGEHAYLVGEAGTGKTHLFKQVCVALGYDLETEFFPIDQSLTKYDVKGYKNPVGDYVQTAVYKAVKLGGFMAIDEGDMWAAAALGSLNSILANDYGVFRGRVG